MRTLIDPPDALAAGLATIRAEFQVPAVFPPAVLAAAEVAAARTPDAHVDRTAIPFVTLDPAGATDLDQAFAIERAGDDLLLRYAIADVGWFVAAGDPIDVEAWKRGETLYLPDGKAPLHPPRLSEGAASLLPDGPRPAVVFAVRIAPDGSARLDGVERALVRSRAKLVYETAREDQLPDGFSELTARVAAAEAARGAARVDPPAQEVERVDEGFALTLRPPRPVETQNACLSLATNLAIADALLAAGTGLFRVMPAPDARAVARLRFAAGALGVAWSDTQSLEEKQRTLSASVPAEAALMFAIRRAGAGATYAPYRAGETPWHAAVAATYCHATAPLRRLADRFVVEAALALAQGRPPPPAELFERLPTVMARADAVAARIGRAVVDLAEATMLAGDVGRTFAAMVTEADAKGARIQLCDVAVSARLPAPGLTAGDAVAVRLVEADPARRRVAFALA